MEEPRVTFETAKKLKELGFDWECESFYRDNSEFMGKGGKRAGIVPPFKQSINRQLAPALSHAAMWLRKVKNVYVIPLPTITGGWTYKATVVLCDPRDRELPPFKNVCGEDFSTHDLALVAGISKALEVIKKDVKPALDEPKNG